MKKGTNKKIQSVGNSKKVGVGAQTKHEGEDR